MQTMMEYDRRAIIDLRAGDCVQQLKRDTRGRYPIRRVVHTTILSYGDVRVFYADPNPEAGLPFYEDRNPFAPVILYI